MINRKSEHYQGYEMINREPEHYQKYGMINRKRALSKVWNDK